MKNAIAIASAAILTFATIAPAAAYHLEPKSTSFTGTGNTQATKNGITLKCKATFQGHVDAAGIGWVDSGTFKGQVGCTSVGLGGLPWKSPAKSATKVNILNVSFTSPIGNCGPNTVPVKIIDGKIRFKNVAMAGACTITGVITTNPALSIQP